MKQILIILLTCFTLSASAQVQYVKDTTVAGPNLKLYPKVGAQKFDSLDVHPTIIGQVNKYASDISVLQASVAGVGTQGTANAASITILNNRVTTLEQGIPITVIDTPKRINVTGTSYTISEGDNGANIFCYSTCTIYAGHGTGGYKVNVYSLNGRVYSAPLSGITMLSPGNYRHIQQYGKAELMFEGPARVLLTGNLTK